MSTHIGSKDMSIFDYLQPLNISVFYGPAAPESFKFKFPKYSKIQV